MIDGIEMIPKIFQSKQTRKVRPSFDYLHLRERFTERSRKEIHKYSAGYLLIDRFYLIGCAITAFKPDWPETDLDGKISPSKSIKICMV